MCDLELPGSNPALCTLLFSRSVIQFLTINGGLGHYCKPRSTPLITHVMTIHYLLSTELSDP
jgi:hypothetical protein